MRGSSVNTNALAKMTPRSSLLDLPIPLSFKELKEAHYRIVAATRAEREHAGREFRITQPDICAYFHVTASTILTLAYENALVCSFARHLCTAVKTRYGTVPVLKAENLHAAEAQAKRLLAHPPTAKKIQKLGAVQFAEGGILGVHFFDGIRIIPDKKRVLLKVLTLLLCFSVTIRDGATGRATRAQQ